MSLRERAYRRGPRTLADGGRAVNRSAVRAGAPAPAPVAPGQRGRPRPRWAMMLRWISDVPASIVAPAAVR